MSAGDAIEGKRAEKELRKDVLALLSPTWKRCRWSWPWGHKYGGRGSYITIRSSDPMQITRCRYCQHPYNSAAFRVHDLLKLAEKMGFTDAQLEHFEDRWRALPDGLHW